MTKPKMKVLIVDDEISYTRLMKANLEASGHYEVRTENKARLAYQAATEFQPDIILMDVMMPDGNGGDVAAQVERDPKLGKTPITFITAAVRREELGGSGSIGGREFIAKPVRMGELIAHIEKQVAKAREAARPAQGHVDSFGRSWTLLPTVGKFVDRFSGSQPPRHVEYPKGLSNNGTW
jgi:DNA-binding response OmpR family regulator